MTALLSHVVITKDLESRNKRQVDSAVEVRALRELMQTYAQNPSALLSRLVEVAMELCGAQSAGLSVEEDSPSEGRIFRWWATAGQFAPLQNATLPRNASPCGHVVDTISTQLMSRPERAYPVAIGLEPSVREVLLAPFMDHGRPMGTLWVVTHDGSHEFDSEDRRMLESLADFASIAWRSERDRRAARSRASRYGTIFDHMEESFCMVEVELDERGVGVDYHFREINAAFEAQTGISSDAVLLGRSMRDLDPTYDKELFRILGEVARTGRSIHFDHPSGRGDQWHEVHAFRVGEGGPEVGILYKDITERRRQQAAIEEVRNRLDRTLEIAQVATFDYDPVADVVQGNPLLRIFFGVETDGGPISAYFAAIHQEDREKTFATIEACLRNGDTYEALYRATNAEGVERHLLARGHCKLGEDGTPLRLSGVVLDITEQVRANRERLAMEERFRQLVELSPVTIWYAEPGGGLTYISQDFYDATGLTRGTTLGSGWTSAVHPEDLPRVNQLWEEARKEGEFYDAELRIRSRKGDYRWISARALPMRDETGAITGWLGSNHDIQLSKETEAVLRNRVAERTADLEVAVRESEAFNYSISHDLRAPLRAVSATASILLEELDASLSGEHRRLLERQAFNAKRLGTLIDQLLRLSRLARAKVAKQPIDMTARVRAVAEEIDPDFPIEVQEGMIATGDPSLIGTVLENLIGNAFKFSPKGGVVRIGQSNGAFWVRDEGIGFEPQFAQKVFLPFERLVDESEFPGTGIGLANVERIIRRHEGKVWAESELGHGATFYFTLPQS